LIDFLDNFPTIDLSDYEKELIDNISKSISISDIEKISDEKINAIMDYDKWINNNEENISNYIKFKESEEYLNNPVIIILEKVKKHMEDNEYYEIVIPLIRKISKSYDEYYKQMLKANKKLMENM
ncbi:MAG TPA: MerR family transcriptional regulator, partial [Erysipelotrichaceae bacterium]|nr:MerR family transcriptional regulator [Erysipelotrichaceae bacterium]